MAKPTSTVVAFRCAHRNRLRDSGYYKCDCFSFLAAMEEPRTRAAHSLCTACEQLIEFYL